ncbi:hypothetical protein [Actinomadura atramentaria]|uniref:hypothetical protein n=1 Tax=Actinomadura atramentaria TaxID=1990 RepID=UPI000380D404|nr:hypothetical protein [Actinomadura atramentaria]
MSGETRERVGGYRLLRPLADGPDGGYRAADAAGRDVAIRFLPEAAPPPDVERLRNVRSPYAADVLDGGDDGDDGDARYLVFRFVPGRTLAAEVAGSGPYRGAGLRALALGMAKALAAVHREGLAHGSLGPEAVVVVDDAPVVTDIGLVPGDPADDIADWAATVTAAATGPDQSGAVPQILVPLLRAATAADPADRPSAADLADRVAALDFGPAEKRVPFAADESERDRAAVPAPRAAGPARRFTPPGGDGRSPHELAVAQGWARLLSVLVVVVAAGVSVLAPAPGLVLTLLAALALRALAIRPPAWAVLSSLGRTILSAVYAGAVAAAVTYALIGLAAVDVLLNPLDAAAFGAGAAAIALWTAPGASLPRQSLERVFFLAARVPHRIAIAGVVLGLAAFAVVAAAMSLTPSFAPLYGLQSSLDASLTRLQSSLQ